MTMRTFQRPNGEKHNGLRFAMKSAAKSVSFPPSDSKFNSVFPMPLFIVCFKTVLRECRAKTLIRAINSSLKGHSKPPEVVEDIKPDQFY
jgi:hypothetical protein